MEKHLSPADTAMTPSLFFPLTASITLLPDSTSCVFGGRQPKSTSRLLEMLRGHGSEDEQIVSRKRTRTMFTALQLVLAFTVS